MIKTGLSLGITILPFVTVPIVQPRVAYSFRSYVDFPPYGSESRRPRIGKRAHFAEQGFAEQLQVGLRAANVGRRRVLWQRLAWLHGFG